MEVFTEVPDVHVYSEHVQKESDKWFQVWDHCI